MVLKLPILTLIELGQLASLFHFHLLHLCFQIFWGIYYILSAEYKVAHL